MFSNVIADDLRARTADGTLPERVAEALKDRLEAAAQDEAEQKAVARASTLPWKRTAASATVPEEVARVLHEQLQLTPRAAQLITEHVAVHDAQTARGEPARATQPLLCLTGPVGVGKSAIAARLAATLERELQVVDLPRLGSADEFLGSATAPGALMRAVERAGTTQVVVVLEGLDRMGARWTSDPYALVHHLTDPQRRRAFRDPYFGVPFDLSGVLLIATAGWVQELPNELQRQLDAVEIEGYIDVQKVAIAREAIVPRVLADYNAAAGRIAFPDETLEALIRTYTCEPGVAELERLVRRIVRRTLTRDVGAEPPPSVTVTHESLHELLGRAPMLAGRTRHAERAGAAGVLMVGSKGGAYAAVEAVHMPGVGRIMVSGTDGSDRAARVGPVASLVRSRLGDFQIPARFLEEFDTHLMLPVNGIPGDEAAAGLAATIAFVSLMRDRPADQELAATGVVTLHGRILPTLGVRHKMLAAHRAGVRRVLLPRGSESELDDLPARVHDDITFIPVDDVAQALHVALR